MASDGLTPPTLGDCTFTGSSAVSVEIWPVYGHVLEGSHMTPDDIEHRFRFHPATSDEKRDAHTSVRQRCRQLADFLNGRLPEGREKSLAITKLEEVMMWGNAALARRAEV